MYRTNAQALEAWCPLRPRSVGHPVPQGLSEEEEAGLPPRDYVFNCLGDLCMWWRMASTSVSETEGYCGVAGRPE